MLFENNFNYVFPIILLCAIVTQNVLRARAKRESNLVKKYLYELKLNVYICSGFLIFLCLCLPGTLSSFGYPKYVGDIQPAERLLAMLQNYNKAIARTSGVIGLFLVVFVWMLSTSYYYFSKLMDAVIDKKAYK